MKNLPAACSTKVSSAIKSLSLAVLLAATAALSARADVVYVTSEIQGCTATAACSGGLQTDGTYTEVSITLGTSGTKGTATGRPVTPLACRAYMSGTLLTSTSAGVDVKPNLGVAGTVYQIDYNWNNGAGNASPDAVFSVSASANSTLSFSSTEVFRQTNGGTALWKFLGFITNGPGVTHPTISFRYQSGTVSGTARVLFDCWRFTLVQPCLAVAPVDVTGPLSTDVNQVVVAGVSASATNITVYQDSGAGMVAIGNKTTGISAGNNTVTVAGLVKGAKAAATQTISGQEGCIPTAGTLVGGGANPRVRISASIRQPGGLAGPIGANGGGPTATIYWVKATGSSSGAPVGGFQLQPSTNWQTIVFDPRTDSEFVWNSGTATLPDPNQFGILEGFSMTMDDLTDTGPMKIYFDNLRNGTTLIQDFENEPNNTAAVLLAKPGNSGTTSGNILSAPDSSVISSNNAAFGTNSEFLTWQWNGLSATKWVRVNALSSGGTVPTPNPELDLTQPFAVDVLILPVGQTVGHTLGLIDLLTDHTNCAGDNVTFTANGQPGANTGTYTYQWRYKGVNIPGATTSSFTTNNVGPNSGGKYSVVIGDGSTAFFTNNANLTITPVAEISSQPTSTSVAVGDSVNFNVSATATSCSSSIGYQWRHAGTNIPGANDASLMFSGAQVSDAGLYSVMITNNLGYSILSSNATLQVIDTANQIIGTGTGLLGLYYSNHVSSAPFTNSPAWTNLDGQINFDWGTNAPDYLVNGTSLVSTDHFTVRWVGQIQAEWAQTYTFYTTSDDGVRLWINGQNVIDSWVNQGGVEHSGTITLTTNSPLDIILEYYENTSAARLTLSWESASQVKDLVPQSQLYPAASWQAPTVAMTAPVSGSTHASSEIIPLSATVVTNGNVINKVQFLRGATLIGESTTPPYTYNWTNPPAGSYTLLARAVYDISSSVDSTTRSITVTSPSPARFSAPVFSGGNLSLSGTGAVNQVFILQQATNLAPPINWTPVATNSSGSGTFNFIVTPGSQPSLYFRTQSQ